MIRPPFITGRLFRVRICSYVRRAGARGGRIQVCPARFLNSEIPIAIAIAEPAAFAGGARRASRSVGHLSINQTSLHGRPFALLQFLAHIFANFMCSFCLLGQIPILSRSHECAQNGYTLEASHTLLNLLTWEIINMPPTEARAKKYFIAVPSRPSRKKVRYVVRSISVPLLKLEKDYLAK